jgi:hypothetical protein
MAMADAALVKKLGIKAGQRVVVINAPDGYLARVDPLPEGVERVEEPDGMVDVVHLFVHSQADLAVYGPAALGAIKPDGLLWISYPKQMSGIKTDINRDTGWDVISAAGYRPVTQVAIDDVWSALRFRPTEHVKSSRSS